MLPLPPDLYIAYDLETQWLAQQNMLLYFTRHCIADFLIPIVQEE